MTKKTLYRDPLRGKIGGVCAGIAEYFGLEIWLVRVVAVALAIFTSFNPVVLLYIVLWIVLDARKEPAEDFGRDVKGHVWQAGRSPGQAFRDVVGRFELIESRLRKMEATVTSREFQLRREIDNLGER